MTDRALSLSGSSAAVIIPCFNEAEALRQAVKSVISEQVEVELVVVDDGSTAPECLAVLETLEGSARVIRQPNQGPSAATMTGMQATSAAYVMRLDADDLLEPGAIATLAAALDRAPEAAVAWGDVQTFGKTNFRISAAPALDPWLLTYVNCIPGAGCLFRRSTVLECGGWQLRSGWEDWDLWLALCEGGWSGVYVPGVAFRYRRDADGRHEGSLGSAEEHYAVLRDRHRSLFTARSQLRSQSAAPRAVKLAVPVIEVLPGLSRLGRIHLCELVTRLFWNGGIRTTAKMIWQAAAWRVAAWPTRSS